MRIMHRVAFAATADERRELEALGIRPSSVIAMPGDGNPFVALDIGEDDPKWPQLQVLLRKWGQSEHHVTTEFTKDEIESGHWLTIGAWHHGYPQPNELDFGFLQATYDLTDYCDRCGIGLKQKAPFQMKREPKWGTRGILQMNWVFDEIFVRPKIWSSIFEPHHVACRPVTDRRGAELESVVQLVVEEKVSLVTEGLARREPCVACQRVKYLPVARGFFPPLTAQPAGAIVKTHEYFDPAAGPHQAVLVSHDLCRALVDAKVRGASFWPVQSVRSNQETRI